MTITTSTLFYNRLQSGVRAQPNSQGTQGARLSKRNRVSYKQMNKPQELTWNSSTHQKHHQIEECF